MLTLHPYPTNLVQSLSANSLLGNLLPSSWTLSLGCPSGSLGFLGVSFLHLFSDFSLDTSSLGFFSPQHLGVSSVLLIGDRPFHLCPYYFLGGTTGKWSYKQQMAETALEFSFISPQAQFSYAKKMKLSWQAPKK